MQKFALAAVTAGLLTASCSGGNPSAFVPASSPNRASVTRAAAAQHVPAGWTATATRGVRPADGTDIGRLHLDAIAARTLRARPITVRVGLQLRNVKELQRIIAGGAKISHAEFMARFAPAAADAQAVASYLRSQRMRNVAITPDRLLVSGDATPAQAEAAFHTTLEAYTSKGRYVYANLTPALVPQHLGTVVTGVLGLTNAAKMAIRPAFTPEPCFPVDPAPSPAPCVRGFGPQEAQIYYDAGSTPTGSLTTVAVMAEGNVTQSVSDLHFSEQQYGLPQVNATIVTVGLPSSDTANIDEWDLDSQASTGIAGGVKQLYFYATTSLTDSDVANEYDRWVTDDLAKLGNSSFGECEYSAFLDGAMAVDDNVLMEGAAQGQTMFASTGDNGSACAVVPANGAPASGLPMVNYPAASPYVVGVGGTTALSNNDDTYLGETAWNAGGGGVSQFENSPRYMQKVQILGGTVAEANLRGLPDVAMAGDPNSGGFEVWANPQIQTLSGPCGNPCQIGGTSESSPLAMGVFARLQSAHNNALGFALPALYQIYIEHPSATATLTGPPPTQAVAGYHDAITGSNGAYSAAPGYDYTNGMGSFDISLTNQFIGK
jgi:subtilase family serine protease